WEMFFAGFMYSVVALSLSYLVFKEIAGILAVFLIVMAVLPMMYTTIRSEEELDLKYQGEWKLLQEHAKVIIFLLFMFLGITFAMVFLYVILPPDAVHTIFNLQEKAILNVNNYVRGSILEGVVVNEQITGNITKLDIFIKIFVNNLKVLFFCLVFSLLYGTGAIFILTWNASVIATAMGNLIKTELSHAASSIGLGWLTAYFSAATFSFFKYMTHGILEITAYFIMALAGGILSVAIVKKEMNYDSIVTDVLDLVLLSMGFLVIAGIVEVYITPVLF
ncbi:MAG: stage II sporulation protein M, partial [Nanoarchaeota archaeon]